MTSVKLTSFILKKYNNKRHGNCVVDYIWSQVKDQYGFKKYNYEMLKEEILHYVDDIKLGISTYEIINWASLHPQVSVHVFDSRYKKFISHNTPHRTRIVLCYIIKDHNLHPILSNDLKRAVCEANQGGAKNLLKCMNEKIRKNKTK